MSAKPLMRDLSVDVSLPRSGDSTEEALIEFLIVIEDGITRSQLAYRLKKREQE